MAGVRVRRARPSSEPHSRHFLRSQRLAAELVHAAGIAGNELVVEIGAGEGRLTAELARVARRVVAVELEPALAGRLRRRFGGANVSVVEGDALELALPVEPYRVLANLPFRGANAILRHLLDETSSPLVAADLIVEWGAAQKRVAVWPSTQAGVLWGAWFTFSLERRLSASCFAPRPSVDAGVLAIRRREPALLPVGDACGFGRLVRAGFAASSVREGLSGRLSPRAHRRLADVYGFSRQATGRDLDVHQWVALFRATQRSATRKAEPSTGGT